MICEYKRRMNSCTGFDNDNSVKKNTSTDLLFLASAFFKNILLFCARMKIFFLAVVFIISLVSLIKH